jgi:energy-coupling factor transporter ATP-binding protein EcfA2
MVRDGVFNMVDRLRERGLDPRRIGDDAWEARCPAHRGVEHSLAVTRNEFNHVVLSCRSTENCQHTRIIRALGWTNDHVYAETPDWLISRLRHIPIQPASFHNPSAAEGGPCEGREANGSTGVPTPGGQEPGRDAVGASGGGQEARSIQNEFGGQNDLETTDANGSPGALRSTENVGVAAMIHPESGTESDMVQSEVTPTIRAYSPMGEISPYQQMPGNSLDLLVSSISVTVERGHSIERQSSVQVLARLAASAKLFRSADGRLCAQVPVGDRLEIYGLKSPGFRDWLIDGFLIDQPEPPSSWALRRVVGMLEARARFNAGIPEVFVRVGQDGVGDGSDSPYFLDLGDPSGRAVAIGEQGWKVVDRPAVHFRRPEGLLPLPVPARDGSIDLLRPFVNLTEPDFRLMIGWLTAALRPVGPYPILVLNGEQGSGKSTLAKILRLLIDPQSCPVLTIPSSAQNLMTSALNGWLLVYENISAIANWLSDCICQLAFGGGFASRTLFTNDERSVIYAQRPVILVGIDDFVLRGDLRDRSVFLQLTAIPPASRQVERKFWKAFRTDYSLLLGGVLDAIVGGLRELPSVDLKELPRMADFAEWGEATSRGLGWGADAFVSTYNDNRKEATDVVLDDSPLANVLLAAARKGINWTGTPVNLYQAMSQIAGKKITARARWPKSVHAFGNELRRIAPQVRLHGLSIKFERRSDGRLVILRSKGNPTSTA